MNNNLKEFVEQTREALKTRGATVSDELKKLHERENELNIQVAELTRELVDAEIRGNEKEVQEKESQVSKAENELDMVKRKIVAYNSDINLLDDKTMSKLIKLVEEFNHEKEKDIQAWEKEKDVLFKKRYEINKRLNEIENNITQYISDKVIVDPIRMYIPKKYIPISFDKMRSNDTFFGDRYYVDELMEKGMYAKEEKKNQKIKKEKSYITKYFENIDIKKCLKQEVISAEVFFKLKEYAKENRDIKFKYKFSPIDRFGYTGFIIDFKEEEYTVYVNSEDIHYA